MEMLLPLEIDNEISENKNLSCHDNTMIHINTSLSFASLVLT